MPPMALHLTAIIPTPAAPLHDTQATHRRVHATTPHGERTLWAAPAPDLLLLQTPDPPRLNPDWAARHRTRDYDAILRALQAGDRVRYSLIANPATCAHPGNGPDGQPLGRGRRRPIPPGPGRDQWARRKLAPALDLHALTSRPLSHAVGVRQGARISHHRHLFTGTATVTDPAVLRALVAAGVGPGKAYGCGLLLITPQDGQ